MSLIPSVIEKTKWGERVYDIYSRLLEDRIIFIWDQIDSHMVNSVVAQMLFLEKKIQTKISSYISILLVEKFIAVWLSMIPCNKSNVTYVSSQLDWLPLWDLSFWLEVPKAKDMHFLTAKSWFISRSFHEVESLVKLLISKSKQKRWSKSKICLSISFPNILVKNLISLLKTWKETNGWLPKKLSNTDLSTKSLDHSFSIFSTKKSGYPDFFI